MGSNTLKSGTVLRVNTQTGTAIFTGDDDEDDDEDRYSTVKYTGSTTGSIVIHD